MNTELNEQQVEIRAMVSKFLSQRMDAARVRALVEEGGTDWDVYREAAALGWVGISIDEERGGSGLGLVEAVVVLEELGARLSPMPFLSNVISALVLDTAGDEDQRERWLEPLLGGKITGACGLLSGTSSRLVPDAATANFLVLIGNGTAALYSPSEAVVSAVETLDLARHFGQVTPRGPGAKLPGYTTVALDKAKILIAAESVGVARRCTEIAIDHAGMREQFGGPIGRYQAVSHRCADMFEATESARLLVREAAWIADNRPPAELHLAASSAKSYACDAAGKVASSAIHVLGGVGFTWEHDLHLLLRRAKVNAQIFGTSASCREEIARCLAASIHEESA